MFPFFFCFEIRNGRKEDIMLGKIVLINGSPKKNGNTFYLLGEMKKHIESLGCECEILYINEGLSSAKTPFCLCCSSPCNKTCYSGTLLEEMLLKVKDADGVVFGSPVYFGSMSAQLKAFFDKMRALRGEQALLGKVGCAVASGASKYGGQETTVRAIHDSMLVMGMSIVGDSDDEGGNGHFGVCAWQKDLDDEYTKNRIKATSLRLVKEIQKRK